MTDDRVPPHSIDTERAVLGAVLVSQATAWPVVSAEVVPAHFYRTAHQLIFRAMADLAHEKAAIDVLTLREKLKASGHLEDAGGAAYLSALTDGVPKSANVSHYVNILREKARLRDIVRLGAAAADEAYAESTPAAAISDRLSKELGRVALSSSIATSKQAAERYVDELLAGANKPPVKTGYLDLDKLTGGFNAGDFVIVAARPGTGKTSWALGAANNIAGDGNVTPFFSLEMPQRQLGARLLSWETDVPAAEIERGTATDADFAKVAEVRAAMRDVPLYIQCSARSVTEVAGWCRRIQDIAGAVRCVFVDYLQLLAPDWRTDDKEQGIADISRALKRLAIDLDVTVVALSQLNRAPDTRRDKRPHPSDLRGSGALEQDADLVMFLFREEMYAKKEDNAGVAEVILAKNRTGPTGTVSLRFDARLARFVNLAPTDDDTRRY